MLYRLMMDNKDVSVNSKRVARLLSVVDNLEKEGQLSKYPRLQQLGPDGTRVKWNQMDKLIGDIYGASKDLSLVPCPVATYFKGDIEIGYRMQSWKGGTITASSPNEWGINEKGLYKKGVRKVPPIFSFEGGFEPLNIEYFKEIKKDHPEFENFKFGTDFGTSVGADKVIHQYKGYSLVYDDLLRGLLDVAYRGKFDKKDLIVR